MKALFLPVLLLGLVATLQAQDPLSLLSEEEKFIGTWFTKAMVAGNRGPDVKRLGKVFPTTVTALEDGNLETKSFYTMKGRCHEMKFVLYKTEMPGKYSTYDGKKTVYIEEIPVEDHYIIYCEDEKQNFGMGKLVGRSPEKSPEALEEFRKFTQRKGLLEKNVLVPEQNESCDPENN